MVGNSGRTSWLWDDWDDWANNAHLDIIGASPTRDYMHILEDGDTV